MSSEQIAVLVVEDEPLLRMDIANALTDAGFIVFEAGDASEAIKIISVNPQIQALFTDIDMPGSIDGLKLAAFVKDRWPPIKIIVTSGHWKVTEDMLPPNGLFIRKPYNSHHIVKSIRDLVSVS
jgi:DNA-binding NtrC family response regulator